MKLDIKEPTFVLVFNLDNSIFKCNAIYILKGNNVEFRSLQSSLKLIANNFVESQENLSLFIYVESALSKIYLSQSLLKTVTWYSFNA